MTCAHGFNRKEAILFGVKKCPQCRHEVYKRHYENNRAKVLEKAADYRKKNPEKVKEIKAKYWQRMINLTFREKEERNLSARELHYVNKLKCLIVTISEIERRYKKYCRIA